MEWSLDKSRPICPQLCETLRAKIATREFLPDQRLPSVREVALSAGVNPNTVQKAFDQLEAEGLLYSQRGSGWFASADDTIGSRLLSEITEKKITAFFNEMKALGMSEEDVKKYVASWQNDSVYDAKI